MSDLYPIWCPTCARQGECHIVHTVPKCYVPKQTEPITHDDYVDSKNDYVEQTDCAWK